ncbi:unnamed protein product, partial [Onchocerca flexuosa]|uniref:Uncharacterized protein n=1 Tax=Onchocerca flexuosa TaxID=387005 RepID=A0A183HNG1_9BILA
MLLKGKCLKSSRSGQNSLAKKIDRTRSFDTKISFPLSPTVAQTGSENNKGCFPAELLPENLEWSNLSRNYFLLASSSAAEETEDRQYVKPCYDGGTLRTDLEEVTNPVKTNVDQLIKANIERTHPSVSKQQFLPHPESRKAFLTTTELSECDDRADG